MATRGPDSCRLAELDRRVRAEEVCVVQGCAGCLGVYSAGERVALARALPGGLCGFLYQAALPYVMALGCGAVFPWSGDGETVDTQCACPGGPRITVTRERRASGLFLSARIAGPSEVCPFRYKGGEVFQVFPVEGLCPHAWHSLFADLVAAAAGAPAPRVIKRALCASPKAAVEMEFMGSGEGRRAGPVGKLAPAHFARSCWYFRRLGRAYAWDRGLCGGLPQRLFYLVYPYYLAALYDGRPDDASAFGAIRFRDDAGAESLWTIAAEEYALAPLIRALRRLAAFCGRPYDFVERKVIVARQGGAALPDSPDKLVFSHYGQLLRTDYFCPAFFYALFPLSSLAGETDECLARCPSHAVEATMRIVRRPGPPESQ